MDFYNFYTGKEFEAYQYLGAHVWDGGTTFRTFAPAAQRVSVIGEFNGWTETPMNRVHVGNFWECTKVLICFKFFSCIKVVKIHVFALPFIIKRY